MNDCVGKEFRKVEIEKETAGEAAQRMRLLISYVEDRIGTEFVYTYSYSTGKLMLVRRGSREDKGGTNIPPPAYLYLRRFLRFCVYGPDTALEGVVWALLCPVTLPIMIGNVVDHGHGFAFEQRRVGDRTVFPDAVADALDQFVILLFLLGLGPSGEEPRVLSAKRFEQMLVGVPVGVVAVHGLAANRPL